MKSLQTNYQGSTHTDPNAEPLIWRIADKARELGLQEENIQDPSRTSAKLIPDLRAAGRHKYATASLATFNKKLHEMIEGMGFSADESDELTPFDIEYNRDSMTSE